jgi:hypothetical protein
MEKDQVFVPYTRAEWGNDNANPADDAGMFEGVVRLLEIVKMLVRCAFF